MNLIETKNLSFKYPDKTSALKEINFSVGEGEFVAIMGANGSGKTTLLKALVGLLCSAEGEIFINKEKITKNNLEKIRAEVGFVFQDPNDQLFAPTVAEDVAFGPLNMKLPEDEIKKRVSEAMEIMEIGHLASKTIHSLSYGQMKKVSLAGVLAMRPKILLLDEPTASLDPMGASKLMKLFKKLNQKLKVTMVMTTHDVDLIPLYADQLYILRKGEIAAGGPLREVFSDTQMIRESKLRLPRIAHMIEILRKENKVFAKELPLTIGQARKEIIKTIESQIDLEASRGCRIRLKASKLRLGYTTGTAAAAAAKAAAIMLVTKNKIDKIPIETPAGITFNIEVFDQKIGKDEASCCVVKDAGDDPDVTNGMKICARVQEKKNEITIKSGEGIGVITKPGLSVPVGSSAINPMPLKMIKHEVEKIVSSKRGLEITIIAPEGKERAKKTFNSRLGIKEGISIIGTTGIVRPMSEASWKTSLLLQLDVALASGFKTIILTPGNIGERIAKEKFFVPQEKIVQTGNWIGEMLDACAVKGAKKILLIGHIGKLIKIVNGHFDTKNARGESPRIISNLIRSLGGSAELAESVAMCNTAEEAILKIDNCLLNLMAEKVREKVEERTGSHLTAGVILASLTGEAVGLESNARLILTKISMGSRNL